MGTIAYSLLKTLTRPPPHSWWLNLACAHRDGLVNSDDERPSKPTYGSTVLPLLTGREEVDGDKVRYLREGRSPRDMHIPLMNEVGSRVRVLRGHGLQRVLAKRAGLR